MQNRLRLLLHAGMFGGVTCSTHGADEKGLACRGVAWMIIMNVEINIQVP